MVGGWTKTNLSIENTIIDFLIDFLGVVKFKDGSFWIIGYRRITGYFLLKI